MRSYTRSIVVLLIAFWLVFQPFAALAHLQQPDSGSDSRVLLSQAEATPIVDETPEIRTKPDIGPDSSIAAEEVPYPIVNGEVATTDVEVLHGWAVRLSNSETSLTGTFAGECSGEPRLGWGNNFSYTYADDAAIWVQAKARDSDVVGPCIKVSWVEEFSQREAPWVTLGGLMQISP